MPCYLFTFSNFNLVQINSIMVKEAKIDLTSVIEPVAPEMLKTSVIPTKLVWYNDPIWEFLDHKVKSNYRIFKDKCTNLTMIALYLYGMFIIISLWYLHFSLLIQTWGKLFQSRMPEKNEHFYCRVSKYSFRCSIFPHNSRNLSSFS